jgi:hypothetical protein
MPAKKNLPIIRGAEQQLRLVIDGQTQEGSWLRVNKFTHTPKVTEVQTGYVGEEYETNDQMMHGHHLTFSFNQMDDVQLDFILNLQKRADSHTRPPDVQIIVKEAYRDGSSVSNILFSRNGVLSPTSRGGAGQKEYVAGEWSFHCQRMSKTG